MQLFNSEKFETLEDLFIEQIQDLYDAEKRLCDAIPQMAEAASDPILRDAFHAHAKETEGHVRRLERVFEMLDRKPDRDTCDAMKGLISEGKHMIKAEGPAEVRDAALIAAAQRVEHYEIAGYGAARNFARRIGRDDIADTLQRTLDEEGAADKKLTSIAEQAINPKAARVQ